MFNFLFYLALVRLDFTYGKCEIEQEIHNRTCYFFPTIEKFDRPLEACQSKGEKIASISIFKKKL